MARFNGFETRANHALFEETQQRMLDSFADPAVQRHLGVASIEMLTSMNEDMTPANIKWGVVRTASIPREYENTPKVPIVVMRPRQTLLLGRSIIDHMDPIQQKNLPKKVAEWKNFDGSPHPAAFSPDAVVAHDNAWLLSSENEVMYVEAAAGVSGFVTAYDDGRDFPHDVSGAQKAERRILHRPLLGLVNRGDPVGMVIDYVHELAHVKHARDDELGFVRDPAYDDWMVTRLELEASHYAGLYSEGLYNSNLAEFAGRPELVDKYSQYEIERVRKEEEDPDDPFFPNAVMRGTIASRGYNQ